MPAPVLSPADALVVGGGPAGLTGALYLARFCRSVLLVDDGGSRAARIPRTRNLPGYPDGVVGAQLMAAMREQAERYGVRFVPGRVDALGRQASGFAARLDGKDAILQARTVLLATGTSDNAPPMPYLAEAVRSGALRYCPVCDGYEVIGQAVGVITDRAAGARRDEEGYLLTDRHHQTSIEGLYAAGDVVQGLNQIAVAAGGAAIAAAAMHRALGPNWNSPLRPG